MQGWSREKWQLRSRIFNDTTLSIFNEAKAKNILPSMAADQMAERRIAEKVAQALACAPL